MKVRGGFASVLAVLAAVVVPSASSAAVDLTVTPSGNAPASIVIKIDGAERARCIWDGSAITFSTPYPACTYGDVINPGQKVRVESFPPPDASLEYLACPTTPFRPRGNFCAFTVVSGPPGAFEGNVPPPSR